jgi:hypothetical protein
MLPAWLEVERYRSRVVVAAVAAVARAPVDETAVCFCASVGLSQMWLNSS